MLSRLIDSLKSILTFSRIGLGSLALTAPAMSLMCTTSNVALRSGGQGSKKFQWRKDRLGGRRESWGVWSRLMSRPIREMLEGIWRDRSCNQILRALS